jgi:hypothetical protein
MPGAAFNAFGMGFPILFIHMTTFLRLSIRSAIFFALTTSAASAESSWDILRHFGLSGVFAYFCDRPATRVNYFETYASGTDQHATRVVDRGIEIPTALSFVEDVHLVSTSTLKARIRNVDPNWGPLNNLAYDVVLIKEEDPSTGEIVRFRFLQAVRNDGKIMAKNGFYGDTKQPTVWEYKCRTTMSAISIKLPPGITLKVHSF